MSDPTPSATPEAPNPSIEGIPAPRGPNEPIPFTGSLTVGELASARFLSRPPRQRSFILMARAMLGAAVVIQGWFTYNAWGGPEEKFSRNFTFLVIMLAIAAVVFLRIVAVRAGLRVQARAGAGLFQATQGTVSRHRIESASAKASATFRWHEFAGYRSNGRVALLFFRDSTRYMIFSRGKFGGTDDWIAFLGIVQEKLKPK